jgi:hypothetical protein
VTVPPIDLTMFLETHRDQILQRAAPQVLQHRLPSYEAAGPVLTEERLGTLFDILIGCLRDRRLDAALAYADSLGGERHRSGYELAEVQRVINVLEETVWSSITAGVPAVAQGYALGLVGTVLGAVKDRLACAYVAGISSEPATTLHLEHLFAGTEGNPRR